MLFCRPHWSVLVKPAQRAVWDAYEEGQEITKEFSGRYMVVQSIAVAIVALSDDIWNFDQAECHIAVAQRSAKMRQNVCQGLMRQMGLHL